MKKPVIASRLDCLAEDLVDGINGCYVTPKSPKELSDTIVYLLDKPLLAMKMGDANYLNTIDNHNKEINVIKVNNLFQKLIKS